MKRNKESVNKNPPLLIGLGGTGAKAAIRIKQRIGQEAPPLPIVFDDPEPNPEEDEE